MWKRANKCEPVRTSIEVWGGPKTYTLIVEPWADEYQVHPDDQCKIVVLHPQSSETFTIQLHENTLLLFAEHGDTTYEFWRNGVIEATNPIPIPGPLGEFEKWCKSQPQGHNPQRP